MEICVTPFPVAGCGSIRIDLLLCWVSLCLGNWWLEMNISVFQFQWTGFTDLLSGHRGHWEPLAAPMAQDPISAPSATRPCTSEMPQPCPALLMSLPAPAPWLCHTLWWCPGWCPGVSPAAPACPTLSQGCWDRPWLLLFCSFTVAKQTVVSALPLYHKSISITEKKWIFCCLSLVFLILPSHASSGEIYFIVILHGAECIFITFITWIITGRSITIWYNYFLAEKKFNW